MDMDRDHQDHMEDHHTLTDLDLADTTVDMASPRVVGDSHHNKVVTKVTNSLAINRVDRILMVPGPLPHKDRVPHLEVSPPLGKDSPMVVSLPTAVDMGSLQLVVLSILLLQAEHHIQLHHSLVHHQGIMGTIAPSLVSHLLMGDMIPMDDPRPQGEILMVSHQLHHSHLMEHQGMVILLVVHLLTLDPNLIMEDTVHMEVVMEMPVTVDHHHRLLVMEHLPVTVHMEVTAARLAVEAIPEGDPHLVDHPTTHTEDKHGLNLSCLQTLIIDV